MYRSNTCKMATTKSELQFILECLMCRTEENTAKSLSCGHSICNVCIDQMLEVETEAHPNSSEIRCPECNAETIVPDGGSGNLPTAHAVVQLRDMLASLDQSEKKMCELCEETDSRKAEKLCKDCQLYLCRGCSDKHPERKLWQNHHLASISGINCSKHKGHQVTYFCTVCNMLLCKKCIAIQECNHDEEIKEIQQLVSTVKG